MATTGQLKQLPAEDVVESRVKVYLIFVDVFKQFVCAEHLGNAHQLTHTHTQISRRSAAYVGCSSWSISLARRPQQQIAAAAAKWWDGRHCQPTGHPSANPHHTVAEVDRWDRQTNGQQDGHHSITQTLPHTVWAASITFTTSHNNKNNSHLMASFPGQPG